MSEQNGSGNLEGGGTNGELMMAKSNNGDGDKHSEFIKEIMNLVDWINSGSMETINRNGSRLSPITIKLEERFKCAKARIDELEGQLGEAQDENGVLKEKLNAMELLAGHQQSELIRLTNELEMQKWERFDAEGRLKTMVKEVAELQSELGKVISKLKQEEETSAPVPGIMAGSVVIKQEIPDDVPEQVEEEEKKEDLGSILEGVTVRVKQRLQNCEEMQTETKGELAGLISGLTNLEMIITQQRKKGKTMFMPTSTQHSSKPLEANASSAMQKVPLDSRLTAYPSPAPVNRHRPRIIPVPIKSILMKRSTDGTFVIRRESQEYQQRQPQQQHRLVGAAKRKRVQFCLQDPNNVPVRAEHKENHRQQQHSLQIQQLQLPPDPLAIDQIQLHEPQHEESHFELPTRQDGRFYCNCGTSFLHRKLLNRHLSAKLNGKIFNCHICSKTFVLHESLKKHVQKSHKSQYQGGRFGCRECGQTFSMYRQLRQHRLIHRRHTQLFSYS